MKKIGKRGKKGRGKGDAFISTKGKKRRTHRRERGNSTTTQRGKREAERGCRKKKLGGRKNSLDHRKEKERLGPFSGLERERLVPFKKKHGQAAKKR